MAPALAQTSGVAFTQKEVGDLANAMTAAANRCDSAEVKRLETRSLDVASGLKTALQLARRTGQPAATVAGIQKDIDNLGVVRAQARAALVNCVQFENTGYRFQTTGTGIRAGEMLGRAMEAVRRCTAETLFEDEAAYMDEVARIRTLAGERRRGPGLTQASLDDAAKLTELADHMVREKDRLFAPCRKARAEMPRPVVQDPDPVPPPDSLTLEPYFGATATFNTATGRYRSTGAQAEGFGRGKKTYMGVCGGADLLYNWARPLLIASGAPVGIGRPAIGGRLGFCLNDNKAKVLLDLERHGPDGNVRLTERERTQIQLLGMLRIPVLIRVRRPPFVPGRGSGSVDTLLADGGGTQFGMRHGGGGGGLYWPIHLYGGAGLTFVDTVMTATSNQTNFGGAFERNRRVKFETHPTVVAGAETPLCSTCFFGSPLLAGVEWQGRWGPRRNISVTSSTFGFREDFRASGRFAHSVMFRIKAQFTILGPDRR